MGNALLEVAWVSVQTTEPTFIPTRYPTSYPTISTINPTLYPTISTIPPTEYPSRIPTTNNPTLPEGSNIDEIVIVFDLKISNNTSTLDVVNTMNDSITNYLNTLTAYDDDFELYFDTIVIGSDDDKYLTINITINGLDHKTDVNKTNIIQQTEINLQSQYNGNVVIETVTIFDKRTEEKIAET
eukprot:225526_1